MRGLVLALLLIAAPAQARELRVCADPNNLPFSNEAQEGLENRLVQIIAEELHADVTYVWHAQRRGNVRETLNANLCDLIPGVGSTLEMLATTRPYYRSSYVAVTRADRGPPIVSFDDPRLRTLRIGVQMVGDDGANTPPADALARRGIVDNVRGYMIYGDYESPAPQRGIVDAVARGEIDVAFVWGPVAGYFAQRAGVSMDIAQVRPRFDGPQLPMVFDVSVGVRRSDTALREEIDAALARRHEDIDWLLTEFGVPVVRD